MKYAVVTFGCRVNQADSLAIEEALRARGGEASPPDAADLVIVNTCSVTASADQGARQTIRRIARSNPDGRIVVTGCYATRRPDDVAELPNVVQVVPNALKDSLAAQLTTADRFAFGDGPCGSSLEPGVAGRTAFTLRVQTGCDERCSYCIIPKTRGRGRSRPLDAVIDDLRRAVGAGYKEVAITGVHLGSYGRDLGDGTTLAALVRTLAEWPEDALFRISSLEPMDCTEAVVDLVAASPRLAPHFHLPLQHASDEMLAAMHRPYTSSFYRRLVEAIRERMPDAAIGADVIVGFPGETIEHADALMATLEQLPLTHVHVFPYSDRDGTKAAAIAGKVPGPDIRVRAAAARAIGRELTRRFHESQIGSIRRALTVDDGALAVTDNYLKVPIAKGRARNEWVQVRIGGAPGALEGEVTSARSL